MTSRSNTKLISFAALFFLSTILLAQQVEVDGTLKVTQMAQDNSQGNLVVQNDDGTLGVRQSSSLASSPEIDTIRNLASDFALAKHMCECQNFPPFLIKSLLDQGYTESELIAAGIPVVLLDNAEPIVDGDGNVYTSVTIGTQTWLQQNLKTTSKIDGTPIQLSSSFAEWSSNNTSSTPSYSYVGSSNNNSLVEDYGLLYNWYTVENDDVCPLGYRVPSQGEWSTLDTYLGSSDAVQIKEKGFDYWIQPNQLSTNSTRFSARAPGHRTTFWGFQEFQRRIYMWSTTENVGNSDFASVAHIWWTVTDINTSGSLAKGEGVSIRCIKN